MIPPLRSRFQCRVIDPLEGDDLWTAIVNELDAEQFAENQERLKYLFSFVSLLQGSMSEESADLTDAPFFVS